MAKRIDTSRQAAIEMFCGSSGSGKSSRVKELVKKAKRLIVFDPDDEYSEIIGMQTARTAQALVKLVQSHQQKPLKVRYVVNGVPGFELFAKVAFVWGNCVAVAEEIAGVTSPGKAPPAWHTLVSRGRKRGVTLYGVTQRPSESDKTLMGNATKIWCGRLARNADRRYLAAELDVKPGDVAALTALDYLERDMLQNTVIKSRLGTRRKEKIESLSN